MPIIHESRVLASLNVVYLTRALSLDEAVLRYADPLQAAVQKITDALRERPPVELASPAFGESE